MNVESELTVAVLTYHRNEDIAALVPLLLDELDRAERELGPGLHGEVLVVDNDPDGGAAEVVQPHVAGGRVRYVVERTPGIAAARNRALAEAHHDGPLVFIDDDERPEPGWLSALVGSWRRNGSAGVSGPVRSVLEGEIDPWIEDGRYFERRFMDRFRHDGPVPVAATNNLLLDLGRVRAHGLQFDESLGLAGGEDTLFTRQLVRAGERIVWAQDAVMTAPVAAGRLTRRWVVTRVFFVSNGSIRVSVRLAASKREAAQVRLRYGATGAARVVLGSVQAAAGTIGRSRRLQARGVGRAARGAGALAAVLGLRFEEYRR